ARGPDPDRARGPARHGLPAARARPDGRHRRHPANRRRLGRRGRSQARRRRGRVLNFPSGRGMPRPPNHQARFTVSGFVSLMVMVAPFGSTTSMSRDARAAAAPAAAPTAPPMIAPFAFLPSSLPTMAPATAPPPTFAASALVTPRPCIPVSLDSTLAARGTRVPAAAVSVFGTTGVAGFGAG